jgi:hypothetical protein
VTDETADALYQINEGETRLLLYRPGCGRYFSLSPGGDYVGLKLIDQNGLQTAALLDLATAALTPLSPPNRRTGQVTFSDNGVLAFTAENTLLVRDAVGERRYDLGVYVNLAPISPDAQYVAFNDSEDQIWLLDLTSRERRKISSGGAGYFGPQWAADSRRLLFSRLDGSVFVYDLSSRHTFSIGEAFSPVWVPDAQTIVFYRKEIETGMLKNSDIWRCNYDGSGLEQVTATSDVREMDPALSSDGKVLVYHTYDRASICIRPYSSGKMSSDQALSREFSPRLMTEAVPLTVLRKDAAVQWLDVPYVNQVYDTPDWFNGHAACGPTTAIMLLAYYNLLPVLETWCSWPAVHVTQWGSYVSERYYFRQTDYAFSAVDPSGRAAYGGYGFMWTGSASPYSRMAEYYSLHGLSASRYDSPSHTSAVTAIVSGPYSICNGLTTAGHIVLAHGVDVEPHTLIVNDPYGNKNRTDLGYPNTAGKNVKYDWPGYNNGNMNFNTVYWSIATAYTQPLVEDTLVDDLQFQQGFFLANQPPAGVLLWKDLNRGYRGHMWWTYSRSSLVGDTCYATWTPNLPSEAYYEVFAYISIGNATAAEYKISTLDGIQTVVLNQKSFKDAWASLGIFRFSAGSAGSVRLGDASAVGRQELAFDAIRWSYRGASATGVLVSREEQPPRSAELFANYPNPFNPATTIGFSIPSLSMVRLEVLNALGQVVGVLVNGVREAGLHEERWHPTGLASGVYVTRLTVVGISDNSASSVARRVLLLK